jgi:hypothetical protein
MSLKAENKILEEAVLVYANYENWNHQVMSNNLDLEQFIEESEDMDGMIVAELADEVGGKLARETLLRIKKLRGWK